MDLEKAHDRVDREAFGGVLKIYGVGGQLLRGESTIGYYKNMKNISNLRLRVWVHRECVGYRTAVFFLSRKFKCPTKPFLNAL